MKKNMVITTYPERFSRNVGDSMITASFIKLMQSKSKYFTYSVDFRGNSLDHYHDNDFKNIFAPGFSVSNGVYPNIYSLYSDLSRLENFFPVSCSFQNDLPSDAIYKEYEYSRETIAFLKRVVEMSGSLSCRDMKIVELLRSHDIESHYVGDMVLYDLDFIGCELSTNNVSSVVFTIQHHEKYRDQSFKVLKLIKDIFPSANLFVAFHSRVVKRSRIVANYANSLGFKELHLYGDHGNLNVYNHIDLHIGYRLHGHISFLRRRKPSILLVEDARAYGFSKSGALSIGCVEALDLKCLQPKESLEIELKELILEGLISKFSRYDNLFSFIDYSYKNSVSPLLDGYIEIIERA